MHRLVVFILAFLGYHLMPQILPAQVPDEDARADTLALLCADTLPGPVTRGLTFDISDPMLRPLPDPTISFAEISLPQPQWGKNHYRVRGKQFIAPAALFCLGVTGVTVAKVGVWNKVVRDNFIDTRRYHFDDYLQYVPFATPYLLKLCGVKGRHNYGEYTILLATSYLSMGIMVNALKYTVKKERPDGSSRNSFPSGHTATAFMGAELLRAEFWEVSPVIGVLGYSLAATIGIMRVYNNRHWVTDVLAGAGIGILSVRIAYWTFPPLQRLFFGKNQKQKDRYATAAPYYNGAQFGTSFSLCF